MRVHFIDALGLNCKGVATELHSVCYPHGNGYDRLIQYEAYKYNDLTRKFYDEFEIQVTIGNS